MGGDVELGEVPLNPLIVLEHPLDDFEEAFGLCIQGADDEDTYVGVAEDEPRAEGDVEEHAITMLTRYKDEDTRALLGRRYQFTQGAVEVFLIVILTLLGP